MYYLYSLLSLEKFHRQNGYNYNKFVFLRTRAVPTSAPKPSKTSIVPKPRIKLMLPTPPTFVPKPSSVKITSKMVASPPVYSNLRHWISTHNSKSAAALKSPIQELLSNVFAAQFVLPELKQLDFIDKFAVEELNTKPRLDKKFSAAKNYKNELNYEMRIM